MFMNSSNFARLFSRKLFLCGYALSHIFHFSIINIGPNLFNIASEGILCISWSPPYYYSIWHRSPSDTLDIYHLYTRIYMYIL